MSRKKKEEESPKIRLNKISRDIIKKFLKERLDSYFEKRERNLRSRVDAHRSFRMALDSRYPESEMGILQKFSFGTFVDHVVITYYLDNTTKEKAEELIQEYQKEYGDCFKSGHSGDRYYLVLRFEGFKARMFKKTVPNRNYYTEISLSSKKELDVSHFFDILLFHKEAEILKKQKEEREGAYKALIYRSRYFEDVLEAWPEIIVLAQDISIRMPERLPVRYDESVMKIIDADLEERGVQKSFTRSPEVE